MLTIFTPSFADEADTNAQNLSAKEIVAHLDPEWASITMFHEGMVDPRLAARPNTTLLPWRKHGNTLRTLPHLLRQTPDIYFFPREGILDAAFLALRRHLRLKTAVITYIVSGGLDAGSYPPARTRNIREADVVVANNSYLSLLLEEKYAVGAETIYDGVDRRLYFPQARPEKPRNPVTVLYAGSMRPYKRVPLVIHEAARWPQVRFRIAGSGEDEPTCRRLAAELKCANVDFLGHLNQPELAKEMRGADIFFFPSVLEGHPQVLLQAAACGVPVVAMKTYRPDSILDGTTGFLAGSDTELSEKLALLISKPELRAEMGKAATRYVARFDWQTIARQWQRTFERAHSKRSNS